MDADGAEDRDRLWTVDDLAARWGLARHTLENWRSLERGPAFVRLSSNRVRYRLEDIEAFERAAPRYQPKENR